MSWNEIVKDRRARLRDRFETDSADDELYVIEPRHALPKERISSHDRSSGRIHRGPEHAQYRVPVAAHSSLCSTVHNDPALFLILVWQRDPCANEGRVSRAFRGTDCGCGRHLTSRRKQRRHLQGMIRTRR